MLCCTVLSAAIPPHQQPHTPTGANRRSFKYKPLEEADEEASPLTLTGPLPPTTTATATRAAAGSAASGGSGGSRQVAGAGAAAAGSSGVDGGGGVSDAAGDSFAADLEQAVASAAAEVASAAAKASRAEHKEALAAAARVGACGDTVLAGRSCVRVRAFVVAASYVFVAAAAVWQVAAQR